MLDENFSIKSAEDGEYWEGDLDRFMEMYEAGVFYWRWRILETRNAVTDEARIAAWCRSGLAPTAS